MLKKTLRVSLVLLVILLIGYLLPERKVIPVSGASRHDWNQDTFWYEPWGTSGVHKGIDIFGETGTEVVSATDGVVLYTGHLEKGGNVVVVLGPKWRIHYFAHLNTIETTALTFAGAGEPLGTLGDSGNARGKPPHLHYSIVRLIPLPWAADGSTQGYKKAFFIDPGLYLAD